MTVEELKAEAAKLPASDCFALAEWIVLGEEVCALRHARLIREIQEGPHEAARGELHDPGELFEHLRADLRDLA